MLRSALAAVAMVAALATTAGAGDPDRVWQTVESEHFAVHFAAPLAEVGQRVAVIAERAYRVLTPVFDHRPAGKTHIVLIDDNDGANGFANVLPRNAVTLYASAPISLSVLADHDDWLYLLFAHEYTHILHLDSIGGLARWYNAVFGKTWAPNQVMPRWIIEGLATYEESKRSAAGRTRATLFDAYLRVPILAGDEQRLDEFSNSPLKFPRGNAAYLYGSHFLKYVFDRFGQINGLSVIDVGGHGFGFPTRISARVRVGGGEVVDIEREVALSGPLHSKGVLILVGLLGARYAPHAPLALSASIVFEQSYGAVEGDSASLAELCVLLSAIGEVPVRQGIALTGSINQHGEVQAIGGVNEKIEGFFDVCSARGLTGDQGVIIPRANVAHLMLRADVVAAVAAGRFHLHAVADVDEALALITDRPAGGREANGHFTRGTVNAQIEARLLAFADDARRFSRDRGEARPHRVSSIAN